MFSNIWVNIPADLMECNCGEFMIPNISTWDDCTCSSDDSDAQQHDEDCEIGCGWSCVNIKCGDWTGGEISAEDIEALRLPEYVARWFELLADAVNELESGE